MLDRGVEDEREPLRVLAEVRRADRLRDDQELPEPDLPDKDEVR